MRQRDEYHKVISVWVRDHWAHWSNEAYWKVFPVLDVIGSTSGASTGLMPVLSRISSPLPASLSATVVRTVVRSLVAEAGFRQAYTPHLLGARP